MPALPPFPPAPAFSPIPPAPAFGAVPPLPPEPTPLRPACPCVERIVPPLPAERSSDEPARPPPPAEGGAFVFDPASPAAPAAPLPPRPPLPPCARLVGLCFAPVRCGLGSLEGAAPQLRAPSAQRTDTCEAADRSVMDFVFFLRSSLATALIGKQRAPLSWRSLLPRENFSRRNSEAFRRAEERVTSFDERVRSARGKLGVEEASLQVGRCVGLSARRDDVFAGAGVLSEGHGATEAVEGIDSSTTQTITRSCRSTVRVVEALHDGFAQRVLGCVGHHGRSCRGVTHHVLATRPGVAAVGVRLAIEFVRCAFASAAS